jgi:hypothetical protein
MTLNLSSRKYQLTVNGADCSKLIQKFDVADEKVSENGLMLCTGEVILIDGPGSFSESLDSEINGRWARGNLVTLDIANSAGSLARHPRGYLRILSSDYDVFKQVLTIKLGDELVLRRAEQLHTWVSLGGKTYNTVTGQIINGTQSNTSVNVGTFKNRDTLINALLSRLGLPALSDALTEYPLNYPLTQLEGTVVDQIGAIAAAAGYVIWVDGFGNIRATKMNVAPSTVFATATLGVNEGKYVRDTGIEAPAFVVACTGTAYRVEQAEDSYSKFTDDAPNGYQTLSYSVDRTKNTTTQEEIQVRRSNLVMPDLTPNDTSFIQAKRVLTYCTYEPDKGQLADGSPNPQNQQRLLVKIEETYLPAGVALSQWISNHSDTALGILGNYADPKLALRTITNYAYTDLEYGQTGVVFTRNTVAYAPLGQINPNTTSAQPGQPEQAEVSGEIYELLKGNTWQKTNKEKRSFGLVFPQQVKEDTQEYAIVNLVNVPDANTTERSNSGQIQPSAPERMPEKHALQEHPVVGYCNLIPVLGSYQERLRTYQFNYLAGETDTSPTLATQQLQALAKVWAAILSGRFNGRVWTAKLEDFILGNYSPLFRLDFTEPARFSSDGVSRIKSYMADGTSWLLTPQTCLVGGYGVYFGSRLSPSDPVAPHYYINQPVQQDLGLVVNFEIPDPIPPATALNWTAVSFEEWINMTFDQWILMEE